MRQWIPRAGLALLIATTVTACADARLKKLSANISKDSVAALMGDAPHTSASFFTSGKLWEIEFFSRGTVLPKDSIAWRKMTPVMFVGGKTVIWGWSALDRDAPKAGIALPPAQ
ncbi:MAG TPA: hypothetical protein VHW65_01345 [Gemmatimonadales bacterium]|nr:hypothetical protein [Gemmatimonadales bacterium]